LFQAKLLEPK